MLDYNKPVQYHHHWANLSTSAHFYLKAAIYMADGDEDVHTCLKERKKTGKAKSRHCQNMELQKYRCFNKELSFTILCKYKWLSTKPKTLNRSTLIMAFFTFKAAFFTYKEKTNLIRVDFICRADRGHLRTFSNYLEN